MRLLGFLEYVMVLVGVTGMAAASAYALPKGVHLGLFLVGAGIALGGLEAIFTRRMSFRVSNLGTDHNAGAPALIWGSTILIIGATLITSAYLMEHGLWRSTLLHLMRRPGGGLLLLGAVIAGAGALIMYAPRAHGMIWMLLVKLPRIVAGFAIVIAGLAAVCLGIWEAIDPLSFAGVIRHLLAQAGLAPFEHYWQRMISLLL